MSSYGTRNDGTFPRAEAIKVLESLGATVGTSVSGKTDALIVGSDRGERKYTDAIQKGVPVLLWEMVCLSGLVSERPEYKGRLDTEVLVELSFQLLTVVDNVYAHIILSTGRRRDGLWRAFLLGIGAHSYFLQAAWGPAYDGGDIRLSGLAPSTDDYRRASLSRALNGWKRMIVELKGLEDE